MSSLPDKKVRIVAGACLLILVGLGLYRWHASSQAEQAVALQAKIAGEEAAKEAQVTASTTSETTSNMAQNQANAATSTPEGAQIQAPGENLSQTDKLTREVIGSYLAAKTQAGQTPDQSVQDQIISAATDKETTNEAPLYEDTDLQIIPAAEETPRADKEFGNALAKIVLSHQTADVGNELDIMADAVQTQRQSSYDRLAAVGRGYQLALKEALALKVPESFVGTDLDLINNISLLAYSITNMSNVQNDPVAALTGVSGYQLGVSTGNQDWQALADQFQSEGIVFNKSEPGYAFLANASGI